MKQVGVIGLGDMGSGLAKNLLAAGFEVRGLDLSESRMAAFAATGGLPAASAAEIGAHSDAVFVMVMNGDQAKEVILGDGLASGMSSGGVVLLTATIHAALEAGVTMLDTGDFYGSGHNEMLIREALKGGSLSGDFSGRYRNYIVSTQIPSTDNASGNAGFVSLHQSN